jgi:hypothetical protein
LTKEKKAGFLKKFIETTNEYSVGANQEFYNLVLKEVKLSKRNTSSQKSKRTHAYMREKLTVLYLLHSNFFPRQTRLITRAAGKQLKVALGPFSRASTWKSKTS